MRKFFLAVALSLCISVLWNSGAAAISLHMSGSCGPTGWCDVDNPLEVYVTLDTEGQTGITLLSVGVLFTSQSALITYNESLSSATDYILYGGKGAYMVAATDPPALRFGTTNQVNVDFISTNLTTGTTYSVGQSSVSGGSSIPGGLLATLVFDVPAGLCVGCSWGATNFSLSTTSVGNTIELAGGSTTAANLYGGFSLGVIPEPSTALLLGLGLVGLAARRRV